MPRIRTIKPEFYRHHDLFLAEKESGLPIRIAFSGLWLCSDKEGRFKWKPTELKLDILPYDELDFNTVLQVLVKYEFIIKYEVNKKIYGFIPTFKEHQRITGTEKNYESKIPEFKGNNMESLSDSIESPCDFHDNSEHTDNQMAFQDVSLETLRQVGKEYKKGEKRKEYKKGEKEDEVFIFWENEKKSFLNSGDWIFNFCRNKDLKLENFDVAAKEFLCDLELKEDFKDSKELKRHFTNWYNLYIKNKKNGTASNNGSNKLGTSAARIETAKEW